MHAPSRRAAVVRALVTLTATGAVLATSTAATAATPTTTSSPKAAAGWLAHAVSLLQERLPLADRDDRIGGGERQ